MEYPGNYRSRKVNSRGYINLRRERYFIGNPFEGYYVGVKPMKSGEQIVWFGNTSIGNLDMKKKLLIPGKELITKEEKEIKPLPMS